MIIRLMTKRSATGNRRYLIIDTSKRTFTRQSDKIIFDGMEVKSTDYNAMIQKCIDAGLKQIH